MQTYFQNQCKTQDLFRAYVDAGRRGWPLQASPMFLRATEAFRLLMNRMPDRFADVLRMLRREDSEGKLNCEKMEFRPLWPHRLDGPYLFNVIWRPEEGESFPVRYQVTCEGTAEDQVLLSMHAVSRQEGRDHHASMMFFLRSSQLARNPVKVRKRHGSQASEVEVASRRLEDWSMEELQEMHLYFLLPFLVLRSRSTVCIGRLSRYFRAEERQGRLTRTETLALEDAMRIMS